MADEIKSNPGKKIGLVGKMIIYGITIATGFIAGAVYGKYASGIKNIAVRNVAGNYKDDVIITHRGGIKDAFIQQEDGSYISWSEERKNITKSIDDKIIQIESEIKK